LQAKGYLRSFLSQLAVGRFFREGQFTHCCNLSKTLKYWAIILSERIVFCAVYASGREADSCNIMKQLHAHKLCAEHG
jgi:hypothetical protein